MEEVSSGVPQGSVLGPILFLIYINDLEDSIKSKVLKFADDSKITSDVTTDSQKQQLKKDLEEVENCTKKWQILCNVDKCKVMHLGKDNKMEKYNLEGKELQAVTEEKDLGVIFKNNLKAEEQCAVATKKANRILGLIKRTITSRSKKIIIQLYKSLIRPHLDYCGTAWRPYLAKDINKLEGIQRRLTKIIAECKDKEYCERLKEVHLTTLETRRTRADLIQTFRLMKGIDKVELTNFFNMNISERSSTLRGNTLKIVKKRFDKTVAKFSFKNRVVNDWNNLPDDIVQSEGINTFKNKIDKYLKINRGLL